MSIPLKIKIGLESGEVLENVGSFTMSYGSDPSDPDHLRRWFKDWKRDFRENVDKEEIDHPKLYEFVVNADWIENERNGVRVDLDE
jgi:hypothetical protein